MLFKAYFLQALGIPCVFAVPAPMRQQMGFVPQNMMGGQVVAMTAAQMRVSNHQCPSIDPKE